jgi:uncharacterized protein
MPLDTFLIAAAVLCMASVLQSMVGFAFGLFAIPLLLLIGLEPEQAIAMVAAAVVAQTGFGVYRHRREADWGAIAPFVVVGMIGTPLGVMLLAILKEHGTPEQIRAFFGVIVFGVLVVQILLRIRPRDHLHWRWGALAFALGGLIGGMAGIGGPPIVFWVMAHRWSSGRSRAVLWASFLAFTPVKLAVLALEFGPDVLIAAALGLATFPLVMLAAIPGLWLGARISMSLLRRIAFVLIAITAFRAMASPWLG